MSFYIAMRIPSHGLIGMASRVVMKMPLCVVGVEVSLDTVVSRRLMRKHSCLYPRETLLWLVPDTAADLGVVLYVSLLFISSHHFKILHSVFPHNIVPLNHHFFYVPKARKQIQSLDMLLDMP